MRYLILDQRAILDGPGAGTVLDTADSKSEAIAACRDQGGGCVYEGAWLVFWLDGAAEWMAEEPS